jgi:hypothetical protein
MNMVETEIGAPPMTDRSLPELLTQASGMERMFPTLMPAQIERIAMHGRVRPIRAGELLIEAGEQVVPFFVVMTGQVEIVRPSGTSETLVCSQAAPRSFERAPARRAK